MIVCELKLERKFKEKENTKVESVEKIKKKRRKKEENPKRSVEE